MKIALIHMRHANSGGTEAFLNQLSQYLAEQGEDVTVVCRSHVEPWHPAIKFVTLTPISIGKAHRMWRFAKAVEKHIAQSNYDFVYGLGKTWTHDMLRIGGGTHYHYLKASGINYSLDNHLDKPANKKQLRCKDKVALKIESKAMSLGAYSHIVANSYKSANEISEAYNVPSDKISVIHNFVDTSRFDRHKVEDKVAKVKSELGLDDERPTFLFLGTGYKRKGLKEALEAFARLKIAANLIIIGNDSHISQYQTMAEELNIKQSCYFLGARPQPEVYFSLADCYVLPTHYEPFGFTVIEAMSCGTPSITTQQCGAKEVLDPAVSTVLSDDYPIEELAQAMELWAEKQFDVELKDNCRESVMKLDIKNIMKANYEVILDTYNMVKFKN